MSQKAYAKGSDFPPLKPGVLRLYSMRFCPFAQRARLVLAHKNIPCEVINLDLQNKPDWFLKKNPEGTVPTLELDDKVMWESTATSEWLDDVYPQNKLQASDPYIRALDRMLLEYSSKVTTTFYTFIRSPGDRDKLVGELTKHFQTYEDFLVKRKGEFYGGSKPSLIDFFLWPIMERMPMLTTMDQRAGIDKKTFPKLSAWVEAMAKVPAVKATAFDPKTHLHFLTGFFAGKADPNYGLQE
ncbi:glutathione S-transferase omega-1-like [Physella acuta]|uniref:glutathione S-transferase omega-1-like n=1 Tax=Physella acuta TaxID=109671 RepID=UPI0027DB327A|nr:glutathione S-transferase omega-1-like [Physella acuta]